MKTLVKVMILFKFLAVPKLLHGAPVLCPTLKLYKTK